MNGRPQTFLVTGGSGFVGRALVAQLRATGHTVRTLARSNADITVDLVTKPDLSEALRGCDVVVHLASRVHVMNETEADPLRAYRQINVEATRHLAEQSIVAGVGRFVFLSSIKVNGERTVGRAFTELDTPLPEDPYGQSKLEAEQALALIATSAATSAGTRSREMQIVCLRPPLVYGPGVKANFAQLLGLVRRVPVLPFGLFVRKRSLISVENLVSAIVRASEAGGPTGVFVVSDGTAVSVRDLVLQMALVLHRKLWLVPVPVWLLRAAAGVVGRSAQVSRLTEALEVNSRGFEKAFAWTPPLTLQEGLRSAAAAMEKK